MKPKNTSIIMERKNQSSFTPTLAFFLHPFSALGEIKFTLKPLLLQDKSVISLFLKLAMLFGENNASFMGTKNQYIFTPTIAMFLASIFSHKRDRIHPKSSVASRQITVYFYSRIHQSIFTATIALLREASLHLIFFFGQNVSTEHEKEATIR